MSNKNARLVVITGDELKNEFRIACDGRNMSHEIIKLMKQYIADKKEQDKEGDK